MNYLDIIMGGLILFGAVKGFFKGFIIEAASIIALIAGILGALLFSSTVGDLLSTYFDFDTIPPAGVIFVLIFIVIIISINLLAKLLTKVIKMAALGLVNRIFGTLFGGLKFAIVLSALLLLLDQFSFLFQYFDTVILEESILYNPIKSLGEMIFEWLLDRKELLPQELV
ncbi:MAG: CvpA family protein [Flavobacteriaceae bacterium]